MEKAIANYSKSYKTSRPRVYYLPEGLKFHNELDDVHIMRGSMDLFDNIYKRQKNEQKIQTIKTGAIYSKDYKKILDRFYLVSLEIVAMQHTYTVNQQRTPLKVVRGTICIMTSVFRQVYMVTDYVVQHKYTCNI